jgi:hypothetical protein
VKKSVVLGIAFVIAVIAAVIMSTMSVRSYRVEVCKQYQGRTSCRTASAATSEQALRAATENACALISSGVTETIQCQGTDPVRVTWLEKP